MQYIVLFVSAFSLFVHGVAWTCKTPKSSRMYKVGNHQCPCSIRNEGSLKYTDGKLMVCDGKEWSALQYEGDLGSEEKPGFSCQHILENSKTKQHNGIYYIRVKGEVHSGFPVYCDMEAGGYTLAFKMVSGNNQDVLAAYQSTTPVNEHVVDALSITNKFRSHYKNRIVLDAYWKKFNPTFVKVVLYTGGEEKFTMKFDGKSSDYQNWFTAARVLSSPYTDLKTEPKNFFSIPGDGPPKRYFFINRNYWDCPGDAGWFGTSGNACSWEKRFPYPTVIYSKVKTYTNWNLYGMVYRLKCS